MTHNEHKEGTFIISLTREEVLFETLNFVYQSSGAATFFYVTPAPALTHTLRLILVYFRGTNSVLLIIVKDVSQCSTKKSG
jgi:hypothetical protein